MIPGGEWSSMKLVPMGDSIGRLWRDTGAWHLHPSFLQSLAAGHGAGCIISWNSRSVVGTDKGAWGWGVLGRHSHNLLQARGTRFYTDTLVLSKKHSEPGAIPLRTLSFSLSSALSFFLHSSSSELCFAPMQTNLVVKSGFMT